MRLRTATIRRIIREALENEEQLHFNVKSAAERAKERGCSDAEIESVMASSNNPDELIMFLDGLGREDYPAPPAELEESD